MRDLCGKPKGKPGGYCAGRFPANKESYKVNWDGDPCELVIVLMLLLAEALVEILDVAW